MMARKFLWAKSSNCSGIHFLRRSITTLAKVERRLGIRNLRVSKTAFMAKNIFALLNSEDKFWIHIAKLKYGYFNIWAKSCSSLGFINCSAKRLKNLRTNLWIVWCNLDLTNFLKDPSSSIFP